MQRYFSDARFISNNCIYGEKMPKKRLGSGFKYKFKFLTWSPLFIYAMCMIHWLGALNGECTQAGSKEQQPITLTFNSSHFWLQIVRRVLPSMQLYWNFFLLGHCLEQAPSKEFEQQLYADSE
jgi:hypothetical protein